MDVFTYDKQVFKRKLKSRTIKSSEVNFAYIVVGCNEYAKIFTYDECDVGTRTIAMHCSHFYNIVCKCCKVNKYNDVIQLFIGEICKKYYRSCTEMRIVNEDDFYMFIEPIYHAEDEPNYELSVYDNNFVYINFNIHGQHPGIIIQDVVWSKDAQVQCAYLVRKYSWRFTLINSGLPQNDQLDCDIKQLIVSILVMFG
jgi:hypothetical protein